LIFSKEVENERVFGCRNNLSQLRGPVSIFFFLRGKKNDALYLCETDTEEGSPCSRHHCRATSLGCLAALPPSSSSNKHSLSLTSNPSIWRPKTSHFSGNVSPPLLFHTRIPHFCSYFLFLKQTNYIPV